MLPADERPDTRVADGHAANSVRITGAPHHALGVGRHQLAVMVEERAVRTERFKYIRNDYPDLAGTPSADAGRSPTMDAIRRLRKEGNLTALQSRSFQAPRPAEELYDVLADPHEINNLANNPRYAKTLSELREKLNTWGRETNDVMPARRTPDEFDRETGQPLPGRKLPRSGKQEINRVALPKGQ